jgi:hypothetical protein
VDIAPHPVSRAVASKSNINSVQSEFTKLINDY